MMQFKSSLSNKSTSRDQLLNSYKGILELTKGTMRVDVGFELNVWKFLRMLPVFDPKCIRGSKASRSGNKHGSIIVPRR